ncbi:MAG: FAD-binding oxidoreductase, partial [Chloroflexota bacterium]|nr:FAD-binding oxidoreductase [Chloroflexota bacterium]
MSTIIVGGGVVGAAVAYFLAERRERDVTLLERAELGNGSTHGGLGGIRHQFTDELDVRMSKIASAFWRNYDDLTGARHDFRQRGYLFIANTAEGLARLREPMPLYERAGVNVEMVDRIAINDLVPGMRLDDVAGGRFGAEDGYGDPLQAL